MNCIPVPHMNTHSTKVSEDVTITDKRRAQILPRHICLYVISVNYVLSERDIFYPTYTHTTPTPLPAHFSSDFDSVFEIS